MNKVICDICGTSYPDTAERCPICGSKAVSEHKTSGDATGRAVEEHKSSRTPVKGGRFSEANVRKRNKAAGIEMPDTFHQEDEPVSKGNGVLIAILVLLIAALLALTGFIFVKFFMPYVMAPEETQPTTTAATEDTTESTTEEITEEPTIPCESLELLSDFEKELEGIGQYYLVNVVAYPADTTDTIQYHTSDESIAVINGEGRVEVVGEGVVTITVTCGIQEVSCVFTCVAEGEGTETPTDDTIPEETEETTEELLDITLFLDKNDFTLAFRGDFYQLKFNSELTAEDITWISENPNVATVENGLVRCVSYGTTRIIARYGEQEVICIVRCAW